jgi:flagellar basal body rod protein FlgB
LGFESLAVETDTATEVNADGSLNAANTNTPGYRNNTLATTNTFDADKSRGFLGLDMTANITIAGTIKLFSCTRSTTGC